MYILNLPIGGNCVPKQRIAGKFLSEQTLLQIEHCRICSIKILVDFLSLIAMKGNHPLKCTSTHSQQNNPKNVFPPNSRSHFYLIIFRSSIQFTKNGTHYCTLYSIYTCETQTFDNYLYIFLSLRKIEMNSLKTEFFFFLYINTVTQVPNANDNIFFNVPKNNLEKSGRGKGTV